MTPSKSIKKALRPSFYIGLIICAPLLSACGIPDRLADVGKPPMLDNIVDPTQRAGYQPVSLPMPTPDVVKYQPNSLWRNGARAFFKDQRAARVGDIVTIVINIDDEAKLDNSTSRTRANTEDSKLTNFLGIESKLKDILPEAVSPGKLTDFGSNTSNKGSGTIDRSEAIKLKVAAVISQVLPNGNLAIEGRQQVRINFELRELQISGVLRPEDIKSDNTIAYQQIAEARLSYGGKGHISDVQQPRYGQQVYDILFPF